MKNKFSVLINNKIKKFNKTIKIPGDKSCSIRAMLFASQCIGISNIKNLLESDDVIMCIKALRSLNVKIVKNKGIYKVYGNGLGSLQPNNKKKIFIGNSGTTARLLTGLLATNPGKFYLYGDKSMNQRDMSRIFIPLEKLGAFFYPKNKNTLPITIQGTSMPLAQNHIEKLGSAQVKSSLLAAFLNTPGRSTIEEKKTSRTHTEILLKKILADIKVKKLKKGNLISIKGQKNLSAFNYKVSSDPSSAAFLIALTILTPGSKLIIHNCLCNHHRTGFIRILKEKMNANIKIRNIKNVSGERCGTIIVKGSTLKSLNCPGKLVPSLIDELPILFIIAGLTKGVSKFRNVGELKHKESDRLLESKKILLKAGIKCKTTKNSITIFGKNKIETKNKAIIVNLHGDHRINMSAAIFALLTGIKFKINNFETVNTSFPKFISTIKKLGGKIAIK